MLSAIQATNQPTLGNYIGAIKNWVRLQEDYHCYFFVVDLHALTSANPIQGCLRDYARQSIAFYLAAGIDPKKTCLFVQSDVRQHAELAWTLTCSTHMGELSRMTQYKDKSSKAGKHINAGLFSYPVLMAADILLYDANLVPVGADQKQHIELTRNLAQRFNSTHGEDSFVVPEPYIPPQGARVMDLQDPHSKMSKSAVSDKGVIFLNDTPKQISKKIKSATTDSGERIQYDDSKPGIKNLLDLHSLFSQKSVDTLVQEYEGKLYGHLKVDTAELVVTELSSLQERANRYLEDKNYLDSIILSGSEQASEHAEKTLVRIYQKLGIRT